MSFETLPHNRRALVAVNAHCLGAAACAGLAWWLWPASPEWWQLGALSVLLTVQASIFLAAAVKAFLGLRARESAVAAFAAQGAPVKSAATASRRSLLEAGMLDDDA